MPIVHNLYMDMNTNAGTEVYSFLTLNGFVHLTKSK